MSQTSLAPSKPGTPHFVFIYDPDPHPDPAADPASDLAAALASETRLCFVHSLKARLQGAVHALVHGVTDDRDYDATCPLRDVLAPFTTYGDLYEALADVLPPDFLGRLAANQYHETWSHHTASTTHIYTDCTHPAQIEPIALEFGAQRCTVIHLNGPQKYEHWIPKMRHYFLTGRTTRERLAILSNSIPPYRSLSE